MTIRRDHVAAVFFIVAGLAVWALSFDLPIGNLAFPGAGMMPYLLVSFMIVFAISVLLGAGNSPPVGEIDWADLPHAARVLSVAVPAVAIYAWAGFLITMALMLFALLFIIERKSLLVALAFSLLVTGGTWVLFGMLLQSPLPTGVLGY